MPTQLEGTSYTTAEAARALGHSAPSISMCVYRHVRADQRAHAVGVLAATLDTPDRGTEAPSDTP
jgi:hypothetical protein